MTGMSLGGGGDESAASPLIISISPSLNRRPSYIWIHLSAGSVEECSLTAVDVVVHKCVLALSTTLLYCSCE